MNQRPNLIHGYPTAHTYCKELYTIAFTLKFHLLGHTFTLCNVQALQVAIAMKYLHVQLYHIVIIAILIPSPFFNSLFPLSNKLESPVLTSVTSTDMIPPGGITRFSLQLSLVHSLPFVVSSWPEDSGLCCFALWLLWRSPSLLPNQAPNVVASELYISKRNKVFSKQEVCSIPQSQRNTTKGTNIHVILWKLPVAEHTEPT